MISAVRLKSLLDGVPLAFVSRTCIRGDVVVTKVHSDIGIGLFDGFELSR